MGQTAPAVACGAFKKQVSRHSCREAAMEQGTLVSLSIRRCECWH